MYKELDQENKAFTLIHCWNKLKNEDKWKTKRREMADQDKRPKNKKQKVHVQSTTMQQTEAQQNGNTPVQAQAEGGPIQQEGEKRPLGQKKAKEALKRRCGEACMEALDKMGQKKRHLTGRKKRRKRKDSWLH